MASFLARLYRVLTDLVPPEVENPFFDLDDVSPVHRDNIAFIYGLGVTTGVTSTTYDPRGAVTRAQMASFLARLYRVLTGAR